MIPTKALRRKLDYQLLRWQARLDGAWADRVLPISAAVGLFVVLVALSLAQARNLGNGMELARWVQGAFHLTSGHDPELTLTGAHLFEREGAFGYALLAQGTHVVAAIPFLLVVQSAALALATIPIWRLCRKVCSLRAGAASAAVTAYALYPPMHQLNLADFHPEVLAVPLLLAGAYAGFRGHWWWATLLCVGAVSMRADLGLAVAAIGVVLMIDTRTRQAPRFILGGVVWTLIAVLLVQPAFGDGSFVHADAFAAYGATLPEVMWGMLTDPVGVVGDLLARPNFAALVAVFAPVAFLPLLAPRYLFPIVPVVAAIFVADVATTGPEGAANLVPLLVFVFLALPFALARLGRRNIERITVDRRLLGALTLAAAVFFVHDAPSSPYHEPWEWGGRSLADQARLDAIELIDSDDRVRATVPALADLASRDVLVVAEDGVDIGGRELTAGVDALLLDETVTSAWNQFRLRGVVRAVEEQGFELTYQRHGVLLFLRSERADP
ncbi:MAG: DUF2079 domain-containing protein [Acidimicrobiales bacterium]